MTCADCPKLDKKRKITAPGMPSLYRYGCGDGYCRAWIESDEELKYTGCADGNGTGTCANLSIFDVAGENDQ